MELLNNNTRPRCDPLKDSFDIDSARLGYEILASGVAYWKPGTVPQRPLGVVHFEVLRQVLTFAVPAVFVAATWFIFGKVAAAAAIPVALLTGYVLDHLLMRAIARKKAAESKLDNGHYNRVRELAIRLNLKPEEITTRRVLKLAKAFVAERARLMAQAEARKAAAPAQAAAVDYVATALPVAGAMLAATAIADNDYESNDDWHRQQDHHYAEPAFETSSYPDFNPANGMPMISGTPIDVTGHVFGTDGS